VKRSIRVLVADDHPLMVDAVVAMLETDSEIEVVGTAARADHLAQEYARLQPDVVLGDLVMPGGDGVTAIREILAFDSEARVVILSASDDATASRRALEAGAIGYLHKSIAPAELIEHIHAAFQGRVTIDTRTARELAAEIRTPAPTAQLSDQERAVLALVAEGRSNPEIGERMFLATSTVKTYLDRIFTKLGVRDRAGAVARAKDLDLI
jgi:DNA-binding NarL/FixJ family response regulator